jgi:hypothetical protein
MIATLPKSESPLQSTKSRFISRPKNRSKPVEPAIRASREELRSGLTMVTATFLEPIWSRQLMVLKNDTRRSFDRPEDRWPTRIATARAEAAATANVSASLPSERKLLAAQYRKPKGDAMITFTIDSDGIEMLRHGPCGVWRYQQKLYPVDLSNGVVGTDHGV